MPLRNEVIRVGNSTGRIKNYYANGLIVIFDVNGTIEAGDTITCDDSGETILLSNNFVFDYKYDLYYEEYDFEWSDPRAICQDDGAFIVQDAHITGLPSQDYQTTNLIYQEQTD
jgi:hypothetical protein